MTVGQVAALAEPTLVSMLGRAAGRQLHAHAHNRDPRRVRVGVRRGSIGGQRAIGRGPHTDAELDSTLVALLDRITRRMRRAQRVARTVILRLRFSDMTRATRSHTISEATAQTRPLLGVARELLAEARPLISERGITLLGISLTNLLNADEVQLALPLDRHMPTALDIALDSVRDRYGSDAIVRAVLLHRDTGIAMPQLPD
jgi:DNA polymerase-4